MATLPEPTPEQKAASAALQAVIREAIKAEGGALAFDQYMAMALYHPGLGYYAGGSQKFGASGDFITSPEVSPLFAQSLARQCQPLIEQLDNTVLIEFGAGSGLLAADLLIELEQLNALPEAYWIIELSAELQQRQHQLLEQRCPALLTKVQWLQQLPEEKVNAVVIANEVLDAMPVTVFEKADNRLYEVCVSVDQQEQLVWSNKAASPSLEAAVEIIESSIGEKLPSNYRSEYNALLEPWLKSLQAILKSGLVLIIDYGYEATQYYNKERDMGSLLCYYRHRAHENVFYYPGLQDITAFVDFTALAEAALSTGFEVIGYTAQAQFLFGSGLPEIFEKKMAACADDIKQQMALSQQVKTLTLPSEMGERFKVMALAVELPDELCDKAGSAFKLADFRSRL